MEANGQVHASAALPRYSLNSRLCGPGKDRNSLEGDSVRPSTGPRTCCYSAFSTIFACPEITIKCLSVLPVVVFVVCSCSYLKPRPNRPFLAAGM